MRQTRDAVTCSPQYLDEGVDLAGLGVPVEETADYPELGEGGDQPEGGDEGEGPVLQDKLLQLGQTVGREDVVQQKVREEVTLGDFLIERHKYRLQIVGATNQISEDVLAVVVNDDIGEFDGSQEGEVSRVEGDGTVGHSQVHLGHHVEVGEGDGLQLREGSIFNSHLIQ